MFKVYDNGGETLDRYTIVMNQPTVYLGEEWIDYIGCNTPNSYWQHGQARASEFSTGKDKRISASELPVESQLQLLKELEQE